MGDYVGRQLRFAPFFLLFLLTVSLVVTFPLYIEEVKAEGGTMGNPETPEFFDWRKFWNKFNNHTEWDLEYNNGSGWISRKQDLQIVKNYTDYDGHPCNWSIASQVKIALNFTASYSADYRLTFGVDLDVKNYTHKTSSFNYTITYQNYTVYFDWTDLKDVPTLIFSHGVKPVGDDSYFWFRIRKNNVEQGKNYVLDPSFGKTDVGAGYHAFGPSKIGCKYALGEAGNVNSMSFYMTSNVDADEAKVGVYDDDGSGGDPGTLMGQGVGSISGTGWKTVSGLDIDLTAGDWWLTVTFDGDSWTNRIAQDAGDTDQMAFHSNRVYANEMTDPFGTVNAHYDEEFSLYANYTTGAGQDLSFNLFENVLIWGSVSRGVELARLLYENVDAWSSLGMLRELGFTSFENVNVWGGLGYSRELGRTFFENVNLWASVRAGKELSRLLFENFRVHDYLSMASELYAPTEYAFTLFENVVIWAGLSMLPEIAEYAFTLFETVNIWDALTMVPEGVAVEYSFIVSAVVNMFSYMRIGTSAAVGNYATTGFVLAAFGVLAFMCLPFAIILYRRRR